MKRVAHFPEIEMLTESFGSETKKVHGFAFSIILNYI